MTGGINWWLAGFLFVSGSAGGLFVVGLCIKLLIHVERDATDPPNGLSNMKLLVDHETGCHYLSVSGGGITPRLDADGKHICRRAHDRL